jgi:2-methylisocitrate lyase-like PEP mutase family enzyme
MEAELELETDMETTTRQVDRATAFRDLHHQDRPLLLANAWSATSALVAAAAGAAAIGTTSFGIALDHGVNDGEQLPFDVARAVATDMVRSVDVPVTFDLEAGRGATAEAVGASMAAVIETGVVGVNIEDARPSEPGVLFDVPTQVERLRAGRAAADAAGVPMFINARCDVFFGASVPAERSLDEVRTRARAYADAGADGLFLPGLIDLAIIEAVVAAIDLPLNVMVFPGLPSFEQLSDAGVRRISQGGASFLAVNGMVHAMTAAFVAGELHPPMEAVGTGMSLLPLFIR